MTNPTPHGQVPEAMRLADMIERYNAGVMSQKIAEDYIEAAAELRRLHAYCQELEAQVIRDCMTHVQKPAEIEHVAGDVLKNGAEVNMNVYAELPQSVGDHKYGGGLYTDAQMLAFADATHTLRIASHVQAPAQPAVAQAADGVLEDAARLLESQHTWLTNVAAANLVRSLAARKQGGKQ